MLLYRLARSFHETYSLSSFFVAGLRPQEEFKREAIKRVNNQGLTIAEVSRKLDTGWPRTMESFFGTLKTECLHHYEFKARDQVKQVVFDYIELFY